MMLTKRSRESCKRLIHAFASLGQDAARVNKKVTKTRKKTANKDKKDGGDEEEG